MYLKKTKISFNALFSMNQKFFCPLTLSGNKMSVKQTKPAPKKNPINIGINVKNLFSSFECAVISSAGKSKDQKVAAVITCKI